MDPINLKQNSAEWLQFRVGKVTASRVKDVMSFLKSGQPSQKRKDYLIELVTERLTGFATDHYVTPAMDHGTEYEKYARAAYEIVTGFDVDLVGISVHPEIDNFCASTDGYIGEDGVFEAKCPTTTTHVEWLMADCVPEEHHWQLLGQMSCSCRKWAGFISYDPRVPPKVQAFVKRFERDEAKIAELEAGVVGFLAEVEAMTAKLGGPREPVGAPEAQGEASEDSLGITDADLPAWYREMA